MAKHKQAFNFFDALDVEWITGQYDIALAEGPGSENVKGVVWQKVWGVHYEGPPENRYVLTFIPNGRAVNTVDVPCSQEDLKILAKELNDYMVEGKMPKNIEPMKQAIQRFCTAHLVKA